MYQLLIIVQKYPKDNKKEPEASSRKAHFSTEKQNDECISLKSFKGS